MLISSRWSSKSPNFWCKESSSTSVTARNGESSEASVNREVDENASGPNDCGRQVEDDCARYGCGANQSREHMHVGMNLQLVRVCQSLRFAHRSKGQHASVRYKHANNGAYNKRNSIFESRSYSPSYFLTNGSQCCIVDSLASLIVAH